MKRKRTGADGGDKEDAGIESLIVADSTTGMPSLRITTLSELAVFLSLKWTEKQRLDWLRHVLASKLVRSFEDVGEILSLFDRPSAALKVISDLDPDIARDVQKDKRFAPASTIIDKYLPVSDSKNDGDDPIKRLFSAEVSWDVRGKCLFDAVEASHKEILDAFATAFPIGVGDSKDKQNFRYWLTLAMCRSAQLGGEYAKRVWHCVYIPTIATEFVSVDGGLILSSNSDIAQERRVCEDAKVTNGSTVKARHILYIEVGLDAA